MFTALRKEISTLQAENKGYKGQVERYKRKYGSLRGKTSGLAGEQAQNEPESGEETPKQAVEPPHIAHPWDRKCNAGGTCHDNEQFVAPSNVFCTNPECVKQLHGHQKEMGYADLAEVMKRPKNPDGSYPVPEIKPCLNCGREDFAVIEK
jgi:hypothetical protein